MHAMTRLLASASLLTMAVAGVSAAPQSTDSATAAATLTGLLTARNLDAIAAADPAAADRFIAALYIPGDQLLVVAGSHSTPAFLRRRLEQTQYRDLYVDLQATPTPNGKLFVEGQYRRGRQHGEWTFYFDNGQVNRKATYNNGQPEGAWEVFRADGTLAAKRSFKNGLRDGTWVTFDDSGKKEVVRLIQNVKFKPPAAGAGG